MLIPARRACCRGAESAAAAGALPPARRKARNARLHRMSRFPRVIFRETSGTKKPAGKGMAAPFPHAFRMHFFGLRMLARRAAGSPATVTVINTLFLLYTTRRHFTTPQRSFSVSRTKFFRKRSFPGRRWGDALNCRPTRPRNLLLPLPFSASQAVFQGIFASRSDAPP